MKYIIMAGGNYEHWEKPRHLSVVYGEVLIERTIRLLKENGIKDIAISTNNPIFEQFNLPILKHDNLYNCKWHDILEGDWFNAFYPTNESVCYIFGDVYFSEEAIKTIVETETDDIEFFASSPPFADSYIKEHQEPFALKVVNTKHLKEAIKKTRKLDKQGKFWRKPIMWELWLVIKNEPLYDDTKKYPINYVVINDYTCDIDWEEDILKLEKKLRRLNMIKLKAIQNFTLERFDELVDIQRKNVDTKGKLYTGDTFKCERELADYLLGKNDKNVVVAELIEVEPKVEIKIETKLDGKTIKKEVVKPTKKKSTK